MGEVTEKIYCCDRDNNDNALAAAILAGNNRRDDWGPMAAIQGNGFALSQLAQTLNIDFNTLQKCCCDVQAAIQQVAGQVGFSAERVINAVNLGDCNVIQALQNLIRCIRKSNQVGLGKIRIVC